MVNATEFTVIVVILAVLPIVRVHISGLGGCDVYAVEAQAMPIFEDVLAGLLDMGSSQLLDAGRTSTFWNGTFPSNETRTVDDLLVRSGVLDLEWPDLGVSNGLNICPE